MTEILRWQHEDYFNKSRKNVIQLLYSEIIFLDNCFHRATKRKSKKSLKIALKNLSRLLDKQQLLKYVPITEEEHDNLVRVIHSNLAKVLKKLD
ncbi:MAG: hypothetical protein EU539_05380 [Promethearchaeota archaeon]|nr:MAG: hypothetical protein EU539_05380 [Candidatus Lokiarchaeota archaeon]